MKIDVVIPTKNSEKPCWKKCLNSIHNSDIPLNKVIIIDAYSTDDTIKIAKQYPTVEIIQDKVNLAKARELGISLVKTKWFAFIDSDVIIPNNWFSEIWKYSEYGNALESWAWGWDWGSGKPVRFSSWKTKKNKIFSTDFRVQSDRARTIATLIETKFVKGIKIPKDLYVLEDEYIRRYLEKRGGIWIKTGVKVDHYSTFRLTKWPLKEGYLYAKYDLHSFFPLLYKALGNIVIRNRSQTFYWLILIGYLKGKLNNLLKRNGNV